MGAARFPVMLLLAVGLAGCGGNERAPSGEREWIDNASGFIEGLVSSVELSANGGSNLASARHALRDESDLYVILVAYTRFGGCQQTLANVGVPTPRVRKVERTLRLACAKLERAAHLFTRAMTDSDPKALVAASRLALRAEPLLSQAKEELAEVRPAPG
jgi:hypothetical protein